MVARHFTDYLRFKNDFLILKNGFEYKINDRK